MEKKKFMTSLFGCIVLCGFAAMALASSSGTEAGIRSGINGAVEATDYIYRGISDTSVDKIDMDSINVNSDNDVAMIDE